MARARLERTSAPQLTTQTLAELERRPWHGNVRELRQRDRARADHGPRAGDSAGALAAEHAGGRAAGAGGRRRTRGGAGAVRRWAERSLGDASLLGRVYDELLDAIEPPLLEAALRRHRGQCAAAARTLGIHRTTLRKKLTRTAWATTRRPTNELRPGGNRSELARYACPQWI